MRLMYMKLEVPASETERIRNGAERRATATAEPLDAAATRSAATVTETRDARDTANSAPLSLRTELHSIGLPFLPFLLSAFCFL